jgi:DNA invertase Pin-like site-specific DNA recombinase
LYVYRRSEGTPAEGDQIEDLRRWCSDQGWEIIAEYEDYASPPAFSRDEHKQLLADVEKGELDLVVFHSLQEFSPGGVREAVRTLNTLIRHGVEFASVGEPYLNSTGASRSTVIGVLKVLQEKELRHLSSCVRAGMRRAKREGRRIGRPRVSIRQRQEIARLRRLGKPLKAIAAQLGLSVSTVSKYQSRPVDDLLEDLLPRR